MGGVKLFPPSGDDAEVPAPTKTASKAGALWGDDDDDGSLFASKPTKTTSAPKKSGGGGLFDDADLLFGEPAAIPKKEEPAKSSKAPWDEDETPAPKKEEPKKEEPAKVRNFKRLRIINTN